VDRPQRLIFLALAVAWTLFRLARYLRAAHAKRPGAAIPASAGVLPERPAESAPPTVPSPIAPAENGSRRAGMLAAAGLVVGGNALIWPLLFATPALAEVPTLLRLVGGVLANLILLRLAGTVAARIRTGARQGEDDDRNPIR
jgi:hypothetical protein